MQSINNNANSFYLNSPPSSNQKDKSKFSKYRTGNFSIDSFEETKKESPKIMQKSALKSSSKRLFNESKDSENFPNRRLSKNESNNLNFELKRVSSKNLDDLDEKLREDNKNSNEPSIQGNSIKNSFEDLPHPNFRRQSSISRSVRLSYINQRKKSFLASKESIKIEDNEDSIVQKRLLVRQRRSKNN